MMVSPALFKLMACPWRCAVAPTRIYPNEVKFYMRPLKSSKRQPVKSISALTLLRIVKVSWIRSEFVVGPGNNAVITTRVVGAGATRDFIRYGYGSDRRLCIDGIADPR